MKAKCSKCNSPFIKSTVITEGKLYPLCEVCDKIFNSFPKTVTMDYFLKMKDNDPIYQARKDRADGNLKWAVDN